jgi:hypothetical protein
LNKFKFAIEENKVIIEWKKRERAIIMYNFFDNYCIKLKKSLLYLIHI